MVPRLPERALHGALRLRAGEGDVDPRVAVERRPQQLGRVPLRLPNGGSQVRMKKQI